MPCLFVSAGAYANKKNFFRQTKNTHIEWTPLCVSIWIFKLAGKKFSELRFSLSLFSHNSFWLLLLVPGEMEYVV